MNNETNVEVVDNKALDTDIKLKRPIVVDGATIDQITLDFESLTGEDIEKAEAQFNAENPQNSMIMVKEMSKPFLAIVASKAAKVHVDSIRKLSAPDYAKITTRTSLFLLGGK